MIPFSGRSVVASSAQEAALQSGPSQPVGTVRRLVLPWAERSVRWEGSLLHHSRHVTANHAPDLDDGLLGVPHSHSQASLIAAPALSTTPTADPTLSRDWHRHDDIMVVMEHGGE